jgi:putative transposase
VDQSSWVSLESGQWDWLFKEPVLSKFSDDPVLARRGYRQYMAQDDSEEIERVFSLKKLPAVLGSREFLQDIKDRFFGEKLHHDVPESRFLAPLAEDILNAVCNEYGIPEEELYTSKRGTTNEPRSVAIFLLRSLRGETLPTIAERFGIRTFSAVSSILVRLQARLEEEKALPEKGVVFEENFEKESRADLTPFPLSNSHSTDTLKLTVNFQLEVKRRCLAIRTS